MTRWGSVMLVLLCWLALLAGVAASAQAQAQAQFPQVYRDHRTGRLVYLVEVPKAFGGRDPGEVRIGYVGQIYWFFNPLDLLEPAFGCRFITFQIPNLVGCEGPVNGFFVQLGPGPNDLKVLPSVPLLPGPNEIKGNRNNDKVKGGQNDEKIKGGKGSDVIDPGSGQDSVEAGPQNDRIDSRDGEVDRINGGKGEKDSAEVDKRDRVKNVEKLQRK